ncbi:hypothetical protein [Pelagerythrobacter marinus]|uniref:hypothetical protein n=1 Tax=Pelagerythrobacter marinus TaxID=538382 RepID=UPI002AC974C9|nr:hypothetical protein [Pelagerythrobacter marinus]WPZ05493.1 hypothetical protein T8T98_08610 [Pelagerythrobacter marinus]
MGYDQFGNEQFVKTNPDGTFSLVTKYADTRRTLDRNAALRSAGHGNGKDVKLAASIDGAVVAKWMQEGMNPFDPNNRKKLRSILNDSDYRKFRIWEGRL